MVNTSLRAIRVFHELGGCGCVRAYVCVCVRVRCMRACVLCVCVCVCVDRKNKIPLCSWDKTLPYDLAVQISQRDFVQVEERQRAKKKGGEPNHAGAGGGGIFRAWRQLSCRRLRGEDDEHVIVHTCHCDCVFFPLFALSMLWSARETVHKLHSIIQSQGHVQRTSQVPPSPFYTCFSGVSSLRGS